MMRSNQIGLYDMFRKDLNLSDDKAAAFVNAIGDLVNSKLKNETKTLVTKGDFKEGNHKLEIKLEQSKNDMYMAMFVSGVVHLIAILSGVLAIVKFMK